MSNFRENSNVSQSNLIESFIYLNSNINIIMKFICRMNKKPKFGLFYYGKTHKFNKKVLIKIQIHGNFIKSGVIWTHMSEMDG